jgi:3-oxoacyl-[acyl-carrier protein] reductase
VIVTGAAGGIGRAIVAALAGAGCQVAACDQPGALLSELTGAAVTAAFDVRDRGAAQAAVSDVIAALGGCDAVVANAGIVDTIHRAERFSEAEWRKDLETNLSGAFFLVQSAFEALVASGDGRAVFISSVAAETGIPGQVAYAASKAGLVGMVRTLATEWASRGIRLPGLQHDPEPDDAGRAGCVLSERRRAPRARRVLRDRGGRAEPSDVCRRARAFAPSS